MKTMQPELPFPKQRKEFRTHKRERTKEGEAILIEQNARLTGNNYDLVKFWQSKWYWLDDDTCRNMTGIKNVTQRVANIRNDIGIPVEKDKRAGGVVWYRLKCTCHLIGGVKETRGCYVHSEELKLK